MRVIKTEGNFSVKAIAGTHTVLIAINCDEASRHGLLGFAFRRVVAGDDAKQKWLRSLKVFKSIIPNPKEAVDPQQPDREMRFSTWEHPIQSFLWGDYTAWPDTLYDFTVVPMYGKPGALSPQPGIQFEIRTEKEFDQGHGIWFNRGAIASQAFARQFANKPPANPDNPEDPETLWLSRGLLDACLRFIRDTPAGDGLRVAAYEFTYKPVLDALKAALDRGVDVRIIYHGTGKSAGKEKGENEAAIEKAGLPRKVGSRQVLFARTKTKIPHNKFIIRLAGGEKPTHTWSGSTNFTPSGFLGQTNVGHLIADEETAMQYLDYWELLKKDPELDAARAGAMKLTPDPPAVIPADSIVRVFSPRTKSDMLKWYGRRIQNAVGSLMFTAAFGVAKQLVPSLAGDCDHLRFILMEKPPTPELKAALRKNSDCVIAYGAVLGEMYTFKDGKPVARKKIQEFELDKWFLEEEHYRRANEGFVFFVHAKFLLADALTRDPLTCSGSANFSSNSLLQNDENMLLIRGNTRVADIYMTEFDRIFRHFYFRDVANEIEARGGEAEGAFLCETSNWTDSYFAPGTLKTRRREMFFADPEASWVANAEKEQADSGKKPKPPVQKTKKARKAKAAKKTKVTKKAKVAKKIITTKKVRAAGKAKTPKKAKTTKKVSTGPGRKPSRTAQGKTKSKTIKKKRR